MCSCFHVTLGTLSIGRAGTTVAQFNLNLKGIKLVPKGRKSRRSAHRTVDVRRHGHRWEVGNQEVMNSRGLADVDSHTSYVWF